MEGSLEKSQEQAQTSTEKTITQPSKKKERQKNFSTTIPKRFRGHTPQAISHIIHYFPLLASEFMNKNLLKLLFSSKESISLLIEDSQDNKKSFPVAFSPSLDIALATTLVAARYSGKVAMLIVPNTSLARKINEILQTYFGSQCQVATTISSLSDNVTCELFGENHIILSTYNDFLRKILTKDLPTIHSIIFYHPLNHQNHSLLTTYLFDIMLLRLEFSSRSNSSLRKIILCDPYYFNTTGYQLLTKCPNTFSLSHSQSLGVSLNPPNPEIIHKHAFILMLGLLFKRHLSRKQLFTELRSSYLYRSLFAVQEAEDNSHSSCSTKEEFERLFEKQLYKAFVLLSHASLGPFSFIKKSKNRYTLSAFGEEFLTAITYSNSSLTDIINLISFLCSAMKEETLSWDSYLDYLLKSFPVNTAYSYNQSFNQLIAFIQQVKEIYNSMDDQDFTTLLAKTKNKLSKLLHSRKYSFGDFQNMKILKCVGQRFTNDSLTLSLQVINDQMLKSFFNKPRQKKKVLYNKQKLQELVLSEVLSSDKPQTASQVALSLNLKKHLTDRVLRFYSKHEDAFIVAKTVTTANGRRTFFGTHRNFPINFDYTCSDCQFYSESGICNIFSILGRLAPHKLPYLLRKRSDSTLKPGTFACFKYSPKELRAESFTLEAFGNLTREVQGLTSLGAIFHHKCIYCSSVIEAFGTKYQPLIGTSTISCIHCGSLYKLSRINTKTSSKKIMVKCQEGNLNAFENTLYELSGLIWDEHKKELTPLHGMTIRFGEKVSLEGDYLIIENIRKKVDELEYLYSSIPLSQKIVDFLEQKSVHVKFNPIAFQKQAKISNNDQMTSEQALAIQALRVSCIFNNPFLQANLYSRWVVTIRTFLLLEKDLTEENLGSFQLFGFEWCLLDILKLSSNALHPYTIRLCEGLAGNIMWLFLKEVFGQKQLDLFTRVRDRYVKEKEFYPKKRTLAYSAISALTNFFLILIQDYLKALHKREGIPWKGSLGLIHGTKKASALYELGFFLDFIDPIKIAALYFLAKAISDDVISFSDVEEFLSPSGATLYAVKFNSITKLESLVDDFFSENVVYSSKEVSFEKAYIMYLRNFFELLNQTIKALKKLNFTLEGIEKSAFSWLQSWDDFSWEKREIIASNLQEKLTDNLVNSSFKPFSYLPSFLEKRFNSIQSIIQSLEKFSLFDDWEKNVLGKITSKLFSIKIILLRRIFMVSSNNAPEVKGSTLPPMKFVCELPPSNNLVANFTWSNSTMELNYLGPILDKYLQEHPYIFQAEAIPKIIQGSDLLITAGTGSGKTEIFLFALIELILQGKITGAIIFYPSKQLVLDQEARLAKYLTWIAEALGKKITYSTYTGDLSNQAIAGIERACPDILLATVDKVFHRIIKHQKSADQGFSEEICDMKNNFFTHIINAKVLVFDEIHVYSGLMLSNIYNYIQLHKANSPDCRVILSSATISEAESFRNAFLSTAEIISGNPRRGTIQILTLEKQYLEQLNNYVTSNFLTPGNSFNSRQRVILFNDSISENESFTIQMKKQMSDATGIELQRITEQEQNKIACIHSQLPPERKQNIVSKARTNQLFYLISTDLLAQGVDFPGFYFGIQIGWPITGLTGAIQRIGRIRFEDDLDETRYFIFVFDPENEKDGYYLTNPKKLAEQLLKAKLPPLIFSRDNSRITQGYLLLAVAYGITCLDDLVSLYCNTIPDQITREKMNKVIRQVITFLIANGILVLTDNYINIGSYVELALFLWNYNLRAIPPKWSVKKDQEKGSIFTIDARKVLREALPGNLLINDGRFWSVKTIDQRRKEINVIELTLQQKPLDVSQIEKNKCFSPEFTFGRFTQEMSLQKMTIQYGDLQIVQKPSLINSYNPVTGFLQIDLKTENMKVPYSDIVFSEKSTGLVITFPEDVFRDVLKHFYFERFHFLRLISKVLLLNVTRELNISHKELVSSLSWKKGQEAIALYDLAGPSGNSQKIFLHLEELLQGLRSKLVNCDCSSGCGACFGDLTKIFQYNPKTFLLKWLETVLK